MPLFMDVHNLEAGDVSMKDVAAAHMKDLETQAAHGVNYKSYWVDEKAGKVFCLVEAPNASTPRRSLRAAVGAHERGDPVRRRQRVARRRRSRRRDLRGRLLSGVGASR